MKIANDNPMNTDAFMQAQDDLIRRQQEIIVKYEKLIKQAQDIIENQEALINTLRGL